jgi:hypothetical protein
LSTLALGEDSFDDVYDDDVYDDEDVEMQAPPPPSITGAGALPKKKPLQSQTQLLPSQLAWLQLL